MITLSNNVVLVESAAELPELPERIDKLYLDVETSSGHPQLDSLNPWKTKQCKAHMVAFTWDDNPRIYCTADKRGLDLVAAVLLKRSDKWINQNIKYDAHVLHNNFGIDYAGEYQDTLTLGKLVDSDRTYKGGYGLDAMAKDYCEIDLSYYYNSLSPWVGPKRSKDYGIIEDPVLADYAGNQVRANRILHATLEDQLPEETQSVYATERRLTKTLVAAERRGMRINVDGTKRALLRAYYRMIEYEKELERLLGYKVNPRSPDDMQDLLINRFGLPPIYTEKKGYRSKGPSFDKSVLKQYKLLPHAPMEILDLVIKHRHEGTMSSLFWETWLDLHVDGVLHSDYNQVVRSGRTSCSKPNSQQMDEEARELVIPREGHALTCHDYSNIEYRDIIHYIRNERIIKIFAEDPDKDFHQMMADEVGSTLGISINRKAAKILNLAMGYGMGKRKTIASLRVDPSIVEATGGDKLKAYEIAVTVHGEFHRRLPELKQHSRMAELAARKRGYVRNDYGRRCHIPLMFARVAFNRVCQSHAADHMKDRANALDEQRHQWGAHILALVHDETVSEVPIEIADEYARQAAEILNFSSVPMRVPIRCTKGVSQENWLAAKKAGDKK